MTANDYSIESGVLIKYTGTDESIVIPDGVISIGRQAFFGKQNLKKVIVPEGVISIGRDAFYRCMQLEEILLPTSVETIESGAFTACFGLKSIKISSPSNLKTIYSSAFLGCSKLRDLNVPPDTEIAGDAFSGCASLVDDNGYIVVNGCLYSYCGEEPVLTLPSFISSIGSAAFARKYSLTEIYIPDSVSLIKSGAFENCINLKTIRLPDNIEIEDRAFSSCRGLADENGMIIIQGNLCGYFGDSADIVVPEGVHKISSGVFSNRNIRSVSLPDGLKEIGDGAFDRCTGITSLVLPESLETIGKHAFGNTSIPSVEIPENTKTIGDEAFEGCSSLTRIFIHGERTKISDTAFKNCNNIQADADGFIIIGTTLYKYLGTDNDICVPDGVTTIGVSAFNNRKSLTSVILPESITAIKEMAFAFCNGLKTIALPAGIKELETCTFLDCTSLSSVTLPSSLTKLGSSVFSGCTSITEITLPKECYSIGYRSFYNCRRLREIIIEGDITEVGEDAFTGCWNLINALVDPSLITETDSKIMAALSWINAPDKLKGVPHREETTKYAFSKKKKIMPVILANDMVFALHTFADNGKITKKNVDEEFLNPAAEAHATQCTAFLLDWKAGNVSFADAARNEERELNKDPLNPTDMRKMWSYAKLEDGTLEITSYKGDKTAIVIPNRIGKELVSKIGDYALSPLKKGRPQAQGEPLKRVKSVVISEGIKTIGRGAFSGCEDLAVVVLPESIKRIDSYAFDMCGRLAEINLSDQVETGGSAFCECKGLADSDGFTVVRRALCAYAGQEKELVVPDGIMEIMFRAFKDCTGLVRIQIPESVRHIGASAFEGCSSLEEVTVLNKDAFFDSEVFLKCRRLKAVYVREGGFAEKSAARVTKKIKYIK